MTRARAFGRDESGASVVEFALLLPVLLALLLGTVTLFDLFRTAQSAEKGTFTVGDMLSRESVITEALLNAKVTFLGQTVDYEGQARLRASSISNTGGQLVVDWSKAVGNSTITLPQLDFTHLPDIAVGDSVILTEVYIPHQAFIPIMGLDNIVYVNRATHRPRFIGKIVYQ